MKQPHSADPEFGIRVLGGFHFFGRGEPLPDLPRGSQHLLAFLAIRDRQVTRTAVAGTLWPQASESHAYSSLRSALSRLNEVKQAIVHTTFQELSLTDGVFVDIREARLLAHRILDPGGEGDADLGSDAIATLSLDLLPDWYEDWAIAEAEEWRQLRLHALDALTERLTAGERYGEATSAALAAVKAEPLRETAHAALIRVYIAEGNRAEALAAYKNYCEMVRKELGLEPTPLIKSLVKDIEQV